MEDEKVKYLRIALGLAEIPCNDLTAELILRMMEGIEKKGGRFSIQDASVIESAVKAKYKQKAKEAKESDEAES